MSKIYDSLIIGGGPAGLSTALALGRVSRSCIVFSTNKFRNDGIHASHSTLSRDHVDPEEIRSIGKEQIERYNNTEYAQTEIKKVSKTKLGSGAVDGFTAEDSEGKTWRGRTLVLAMGCKDIFPDIPGYADNWPLNIWQCMFCDGFERRQRKSGVLATPDFSPMVSLMAAMVPSLARTAGTDRLSYPNKEPGSTVTIFTNGPLKDLSEASLAALETAKAQGIAIDERRILRLEPNSTSGKQEESDGLTVILLDGDSTESSLSLGFFVDKPTTIPNGQNLIDQLGIETETQGWATYIKPVAPSNGTNVPGVFTAGDVSTQLTQVTAAMYNGVAAAGGVTHYCIKQETAVALERYKRDGSGRMQTEVSIVHEE